MSLESLQASMLPALLQTDGENWHEHTFRYGDINLALGDIQIETMMKRFFGARSLVYTPEVFCWYDEDVGFQGREGYKGPWQDLTGIYICGVLWGVQVGEIAVPTHFFLRRLVNYTAPLCDWKHDLRFPQGTKNYSVCALLPDDFEWKGMSMYSSDNDVVRQFEIKALRRYGINFDVMREWMTYEKFKRNT